MASNDIRKFRFTSDLVRFKWGYANFDDFQQWIFDTIGALGEALCGPSCVSGLKVSPFSGMTVRTAPGIAVNNSGQILVVANDTDVAISSPVGNPAKSLLVLRPNPTDMTPVPIPLNPAFTTNLHELQAASVVALNGTPAASPVFPTPNADDVVLMGFSLSAGHATILTSNYDVGQRSVLGNLRKKVRLVSANYSALNTDDIIEVDTTSGDVTITLPLAIDGLGKVITILKSDSSANSVLIVGTGGELISGLATVDLDTQWMKAVVYGDGKSAWRMI